MNIMLSKVWLAEIWRARRVGQRRPCLLLASGVLALRVDPAVALRNE